MELDVWMYLVMEGVELLSLYFVYECFVFVWEGILFVDCEYIYKCLEEEEVVEICMVCCWIIGDMICIGVWEFEAKIIEDIIKEVFIVCKIECGGWIDDKCFEIVMEDWKK